MIPMRGAGRDTQLLEKDVAKPRSNDEKPCLCGSPSTYITQSPEGRHRISCTFCDLSTDLKSTFPAARKAWAGRKVKFPHEWDGL